MTENDLIAKVAEIEDRAQIIRNTSAVWPQHPTQAEQDQATSDLVMAGDALSGLPPGLLSAMARVAVAKMVGDMTGEAAALSAFRALLEGAKP